MKSSVEIAYGVLRLPIGVPAVTVLAGATFLSAAATTHGEARYRDVGNERS